MTNSSTAAQALALDVNLDDEDSILRAALALNTTPDAVRGVLTFAESVLTQAEEHEMTRRDLVTALLSVLTIMVKACDEPVEQGAICLSLSKGLWASCDLPEDSAFMQEVQAMVFYELMPPSTGSEQIH